MVSGFGGGDCISAVGVMKISDGTTIRKRRKPKRRMSIPSCRVMKGRREYSSASNNAEGVRYCQPRATPWVNRLERCINPERVRKRLIPNIAFVKFNLISL